MKVFFIGQKGIPSKFGGIETHVTELATRLVRAGHEVMAYVRPWYVESRETKYNGIRLIRMPSLHTKHLDAISHTFFSLLHACLLMRPDVIHLHGVGPALLAWIPRVLRPNTTVIVTFHCIDACHSKWGFFAKWMLRLGERAALSFAHETIAVGKTLGEYITVQYGKRVPVIPNGITIQRTTTDDVIIRPFGLSSGNYILSVSRLVPHKQIHTLIAAWKKAKEMHPEALNRMKLAIAGGSTFTDDYVRHLHEIAADDPSIVFTGYQSGSVLRALFAGARFVAHPSIAEGMPIAILEAMSHGKAVIAADIPENKEVVSEYGILYRAGDADALAEKIVELAKDRMETASIGHAARVYVEEFYNWDMIAEHTIDVYEQHVALRRGKLATR